MAEVSTPDPTTAQTCFIAMPISTRTAEADRYGDVDHWEHVMDSLFVPAIRDAGFEPIRPVAVGAHLIHGEIIHHLSRASLVLCDLSGHNPNVFFELGVRTSLNLPIALVRDEHTDLPFDTAGINTHAYASALRGWELEDQRSKLALHIKHSAESCRGTNPLWRQFGLTIRAQEPDATESPLEAKVDLISDRLEQLQWRMSAERAEQVRRDEVANFERGIRTRADPVGEIWRPADRHVPYGVLIEAIERFAAKKGLVYEAAPTNDSGTQVLVRITGDWSITDAERLHELGKRYGIEVLVLDGLARAPKKAPEDQS